MTSIAITLFFVIGMVACVAIVTSSRERVRKAELISEEKRASVDIEGLVAPLRADLEKLRQENRDIRSRLAQIR